VETTDKIVLIWNVSSMKELTHLETGDSHYRL